MDKSVIYEIEETLWFIKFQPIQKCRFSINRHKLYSKYNRL